MSVHDVFPEQYHQQFEAKIQRIQSEFAEFEPPALESFESEKSHYRQRAEFKIWHEGDASNYAMYAKDEYKKPYTITSFPIGSKKLNELMADLLPKINGSETLRRKLFQVEFLCSKSGDSLITMIYHKPLDEEWQKEATALQDQLKTSIIGRSKKQKIILDRDFVNETLDISGRKYHYQQVEASFTQPNAGVCEKMVSWALDCTKETQGDLIELYCGNGNFTIPLATQFDKVLATEISKTSVKSAQENCRRNDIDNIQIARMSAEEFTEAMDGVRKFRRLKDIELEDYDLKTIFVDPPRAGLDKATEEMVTRFENILYVSCNPTTLKGNLEHICKTHKISRFALFDQFPYTDHVECGVWLQRRQ